MYPLGNPDAGRDEQYRKERHFQRKKPELWKKGFPAIGNYREKNDTEKALSREPGQVDAGNGHWNFLLYRSVRIVGC